MPDNETTIEELTRKLWEERVSGLVDNPAEFIRQLEHNLFGGIASKMSDLFKADDALQKEVIAATRKALADHVAEEVKGRASSSNWSVRNAMDNAVNACVKSLAEQAVEANKDVIAKHIEHIVETDLDSLVRDATVRALGAALQDKMGESLKQAFQNLYWDLRNG